MAKHSALPDCGSYHHWDGLVDYNVLDKEALSGVRVSSQLSSWLCFTDSFSSWAIFRVVGADRSMKSG